MQSICHLAGLTACLLAVAVALKTPHQRPPRIGFLGMRGKRDAPRLAHEVALETRQRRLSYPISRLLRLSELYGDLYERADRAPSGFTGLRGKKVPSGFSGLRGKRTGPRRVPSGFAGLRGKKSGPTALETLRGMLEEAADEKRSPSGAFLGLRGRRQAPLEAE
ncbi:tachykinins-like [Pollicipes pollicipes]|uniref:tachykinins-like n=1 Tax=Pollicipes pollicipes TaxID=41117 RepID=UPI001884F31A|nr:tachykinins-like [Pollicipes pollicipes]